MRIYLFALVVSLLPSALFAQDSLELQTSDIEGLKILDQKYFTGSNLWGHIDGAADLFLEYGFRDLRYYQVSKDEVKLDIEIYRFENPYEAYGIYSVKKFGCLAADSSVNPMFCQTKYALSFSVSDYYVTIAGSHGSAKEQNLAKQIADILYAKPDNKGLTTKDIFPEKRGQFKFNDVKIIMGPLGFQNGLPDWSSRFGDYSGYVCVWYSVGYNDENINVFLFNFKIPAQLNRMILENGWKMKENELSIEGSTNWLIKRTGDMLMILTGKVPVNVLEELQDME